MSKFTDVMVDIETTGTSPDRTAILQIAAVKFNLETREVDPDFFEACLTMPPHRFWDTDTSAWWNRQKPEILKDILARRQDYKVVIESFARWSYQSPGLRFWSKPVTFDFMFLSSYFSDANLINPFHYRIARDMASYIEGLHYPNPVPDIAYKDMGGNAHNALNDTLVQLDHLFNHIDYSMGKKHVKS